MWKQKARKIPWMGILGYGWILGITLLIVLDAAFPKGIRFAAVVCAIAVAVVLYPTYFPRSGEDK